MSQRASAAFSALAQEVRRLLEPIVAGHRVLLTGAAINNTALRDLILKAHAQSVHALPLPVGDQSPIDRRVARIEHLLSHPPFQVRRALKRLDPDGNAIVYAGSFTAQRTVAGRRLIGVRAPDHFAAERKDQQRAIVGHRHRARIELANVDAIPTLRTLVRRHDVVISGVPRRDLALGASHTYLLTGNTDVRAIAQRLVRDCDIAFVSRRDVGLPCTYYGFVHPAEAIEFGPVEALVYWNRRTHRVRAIGIARPFEGAAEATFADVTVQRAAMRLASKVGYRGAFCTDGVVTPNEYIIHEINPRLCAGFALLSSIAGGFPFSAVDLVLRERPAAETAGRLMQCLRDAAATLRVQRRMVKVWHDSRQSEAAILSLVTADDHAWLQNVRRAFGGPTLRPLIDVAEQQR